MNRRVTVSDRGREYLEKGQLWMYRNNLVSADEEIRDGDIIDIIGEDGAFVGRGFYSAVSHIVVRILTFDQKQSIDEDFFRIKVDQAIELREQKMEGQQDNCRVIYGEADGLPGLTVDRYNSVLVSQISCAGMEKRKEMLYRLLTEEYHARGVMIEGIYERNDIRVREKEGLPLHKGFYESADLPTATVITENGIRVTVDYANGQKTGYFLDQKFNRLYLQKMAKGLRVLDCFSHTGGFALNAAKGGAEAVVAVDVSRSALDQGYQNALMNGLEKKITFVQDDVFDYLNKCTRGKYDLIVLDPPAFTKNRRTVDHAYKGYLEINRRAISILEDGGYLISCSCSRFMEKENFERMLQQAAQEEGVILNTIHVGSQSPDHPVLSSNEETEYLKFYVLRVSRKQVPDDIKAIFFDLDSTVLSHTGIPVRESTREAFRLLKEKGIKRICCTGRTGSEIQDIRRFALDFDGYYTDNSQSYYDQDMKLVEQSYLNQQQTAELVSFFNMKIVPMQLGAADYMILNYDDEVVDKVIDDLDVPKANVGTYNGEKLLNGVAYVSREQEEMIRPYLPNAIFARWNPYGTDIIYNARGKAGAISDYAEKNHILKQEIMAFGDSFNDIPMLKAAGYAVAMGNGEEEIKKIADYVAPEIDDDGIYKALKYLKLI
ncbi:MAG: HAD-IIB family hydrolase [Erysipelotrichaceae bacterium]|nr:HAD-IIB family hydrolase [Erysipelotrichaceae bacterium]